ncbi:MAG TPA: helicase, partial [bacterium]|nr:helicase [bacterium]
MPSKFITNQNELLADVIDDILPSTDKLHFLVGYFYFSGFEQLYQNLIDKQMRILIGMDVERGILNKIKQFEIIQEVNISRGQIKQNYFNSLVTLFNDTDFFDTEEKQAAFKLFLNKIRDGSLEIRKTEQPNHAKLYLFEKKPEHSEGGRYPGAVITGSSNLSLSGLTSRNEINVVFRDEHYLEGKELFDQLWESAIDIVNKNDAVQFESQVVEKIWLEKLPLPFFMYVRVLDEYFTFKKPLIRFPAEITGNRFFNLKYQTDAIYQALNIIEKHNGVIVADVVGLGKSIVASAIAHNLRMKTIIIAPPHLTDQWNDYRFSYDYNARVFSSGSIDKALKQMSRDEQKLIIIDEAHKYRNEQTRDYGNLHQLCQGNKVMLLTATPFNNRPQDIFSMIKLFQIPARSTIQTIDNLAYQFRELIKQYKAITKSQREKLEPLLVIKSRIAQLAREIRNLISPLLIRRSRLDLNDIDEYREDLQKQKIELNIVEPPMLLEYDLGELAPLYVETLENIAPKDENSKTGFIGARYKPTQYLKNIDKYRDRLQADFGDENLFFQTQINLAKFMRRLLVHRFESSKFSFNESLKAMIKSAEVIKGWYDRLGKVPIYKKGKLPDVDSLLLDGGIELDADAAEINFEDLLQTYQKKGLITIDRADLSEQFIQDVIKDIELLSRIKDQWFSKGIGADPKIERLKKLLQVWLRNEPKRKIVIFSEFGDTVNYLEERLEKDFRLFKYTSKDANKTNKKTIRENFDAGLPKDEQKNDFDILIATDAISEGFNLHRAGIIFNYDIPYNPTRVIQRVGRINRINKKVFDRLYIYNFFPTATGEDETRIKQITTLKFDMINALLGEDTLVLTDETQLESFFREQYEQELAAQEERSWDVDYRNLLNHLKMHQPEIVQKARELPRRSRVRRSAGKEKQGVVIFGRKGEDYKFKLGSKDEDFAISAETALKLFAADVNEKPEQVSPAFEAIYQRL